MTLLNRYIFLCVLILQPSAFLCAGSGENAALSYYQAFLLLPEENEKLFENWPEVPTGQATEDILNEARKALWFFHRGAQRKECDWGIATEEGWFATIPYGLNDYARRVTSLVSLQARSRSGRNEIGAVQSIIDLLVFARHVEIGFSIISKFTQMEIERWAMDTAVVILPKLAIPEIEKLKQALGSLPPASSAEEVWKGQKDFITRWLRANFVNSKNLEKRINHYRRLNAETELRLSKRVDLVFELAHNRKAFKRKLKQARDLWKEERLLFENWRTRENPVQAAVRLTKRYYKNEIAIAFSRTPNIRDPLWYCSDRAEVRFSMFRAALQVALHGKKSIAGRKDPLMGKPFRYEKTKDGFTISSAPFEEGDDWLQLVLRAGKGGGIEKRVARTKSKLGADNEGAESES